MSALSVLAHATWFTEGQAAYDLSFAARPLSLAAVLAAAAVALAWRRAGGALPRPELPLLEPLGRLAPWIPRALAAHVGVSLLVQAFRAEYLAPSLALPSAWWGLALAALEALVGVWFLVGVRVRPAAWLLVAAGPLGMLGFGVLPILERVDLLGVALFLALLPPDDTRAAGRVPLDPERLRTALFGLRVLAGSALIVVAFTEKLARPELTLAFLHDHPMFNVAQVMGLPVSHELFIQVAAGVEILVGLLLILGALPQLVGLLAAVPFTLPVAALGTPELLGHLPIYGVLLALVVNGSHPATAAACAWLPRPAGVPRLARRARGPAGAGRRLPALTGTHAQLARRFDEGWSRSSP